MIINEYDEVWLVYEHNDLLCVVDNERKAEIICNVIPYATWKRFIAPKGD
jgi:hypothetical protein